MSYPANAIKKSRRILDFFRDIVLLGATLSAGLAVAASASPESLTPQQVDQQFLFPARDVTLSLAKLSNTSMALEDPAPPPSCQTFYLGSLGIRCTGYSDQAPSASPGTDAPRSLQ